LRTLNEVYSSLATRRRYEVWFLRLGLADGRGAWWFRYLLMNPGRSVCAGGSGAQPVQVWATWFPRDAKPQTFIQGFPLENLQLSHPSEDPFFFRVDDNQISQNSCRGALNVDGHQIAWDLQYRSTFRVTLSNKGWIGFSRTPHSNARFSGEITLDGQRFTGDPLGFGLQGHNSGYKHRGFWKWAHAYFLGSTGSSTTLEALVYDMPFGLVFRKAVLWHEGERYIFRNLRDTDSDPTLFQWNFSCTARNGVLLSAAFDGSGVGIHRLPYTKTDCSGSFEVTNNSLARASLELKMPDGSTQHLRTGAGAVLEMAGEKLVHVGKREPLGHD
jgi:hypothetical protein